MAKCNQLTSLSFKGLNSLTLSREVAYARRYVRRVSIRRLLSESEISTRPECIWYVARLKNYTCVLLEFALHGQATYKVVVI